MTALWEALLPIEILGEHRDESLAQCLKVG